MSEGGAISQPTCGASHSSPTTATISFQQMISNTTHPMIRFLIFFANSIYECENTIQLIQFYRATMGYPVTSTWCKSIDAGYFQGWSSLTSKRLRRFIKVVAETEQGHMDQQKAGTRSTRANPEPNSMESVPQTPLNERTHHVYMSITEVAGHLYTDQTGRFPITSNRGNCYVIIFYAVGGNYIKSYPIKSRHRLQLLKAYE